MTFWVFLFLFFPQAGKQASGSCPVPAPHWKVLNKTCASFHCIFPWKEKTDCLPTPPGSERVLEEEIPEKNTGTMPAAPEVTTARGQSSQLTQEVKRNHVRLSPQFSPQNQSPRAGLPCGRSIYRTIKNLRWAALCVSKPSCTPFPTGLLLLTGRGVIFLLQQTIRNPSQ